MKILLQTNRRNETLLNKEYDKLVQSGFEIIPFGYLYEKCRVANLFIFEPDLDLFYASLYCFAAFIISIGNNCGAIELLRYDATTLYGTFVTSKRTKAE